MKPLVGIEPKPWNKMAQVLFPIGLSFCHWIHFFHQVKMKMPQLAFLCVCENLVSTSIPIPCMGFNPLTWSPPPTYICLPSLCLPVLV